MKKAFSLLLAMGMLLSFAACGGNTSSTAEPAAPTSTVEETPAENNNEEGEPEGGEEAPAATLDADVIRIGGIAPLTGAASQYGVAVNNGVKMAIDEINAAGGILGVQIEYTVEDDQHNPEQALNAYNKLMNDGIDVLIGAVTSAPSVAVAQEAAMDGIPMISASATQEDFTLAGSNIFRTCFIDPMQGELMANYSQERLGAEKVAVLYDQDDDYSTGIAVAYKAAAEALGMEVVAYESFTDGTVNYSSQLTKIKDASPDVVFASTYYEQGALIVPQARDLGIDCEFLGPDGWDGVLNQVDPSNYEKLNNSYFCNQYSRESQDPQMQSFLANYQELYGIEENMFAVLGYDTVFIVKAAIEAAGSLEQDAIVEAMTNVSVTGLTGTTTFDENRNPVRTAVITEFVDGEAVVVEEYNFS